MNKTWDLIVAGGGTSGVSAAISAARLGCKVLIIEKNGFLGGTATGALVTPLMKNKTEDGVDLTNGLLAEVLSCLEKTGDCATHKNGNNGWINPEMLKCVLDDFCERDNTEVLFDTIVVGASVADNKITAIKCHNKGGAAEFQAKYYIDATGDADLAAVAGIDFESKEHQSFSLRFNMANVNIEAFAGWLNEIDPDSGVSSVDYHDYETILLTTAHTWEDKNFKLRPYFNYAVREGILEHEDGAYFQVFSIPGQKNAVAFNCPRIPAQGNPDPLNPYEISFAYKQGRKQIRRLAEFCKKYLTGFEEAYISQIAPMLGIRDSRRIKGIYKLTEEDIIDSRKFKNAAAKSNYPIDVHSSKAGMSELTHLVPDDYYEIPIECLIPENINNLLVAGRCISATFRAQASLRIQPNCWAMGESAGKYAANLINKTI